MEKKDLFNVYMRVELLRYANEEMTAKFGANKMDVELFIEWCNLTSEELQRVAELLSCWDKQENEKYTT